MTEKEWGLLLAVVTALGGSLIGALKWAVNRVTKSNDDGTAALVANTASNAVLVTKIDALARSIERLDDFVKEEVSGVYSTPPQPARQRASTPRSIPIDRPWRRGTDEDR
jgi:hypothetical protein